MSRTTSHHRRHRFVRRRHHHRDAAASRTSSAARSIDAQVIEGDSFHRFDRVEMRERVRKADHGEGPQISHFGPESNLLAELERTFAEYGETGSGKVRKYMHDAEEAKQLGSEPGTFTPWQPMADGSDLLFYEGLHGGYVGPDANVARHVDLLVGVVPIINLEWIQKLHRDQNLRGYSQEAVVDTILRRMPDYVNHICPQFSRTHVNFQRVPTVDTCNPFIAEGHPERRRSHGRDPLRQPQGHRLPVPDVDAAGRLDEPAQQHRRAGRQDGPGDAADLHADDPAPDGHEAPRRAEHESQKGP